MRAIQFKAKKKQSFKTFLTIIFVCLFIYYIFACVASS